LAPPPQKAVGQGDGVKQSYASAKPAAGLITYNLEAILENGGPWAALSLPVSEREVGAMPEGFEESVTNVT
jgi:hypothetical protein